MSIRVLVVDDSQLIRDVLSRSLVRDGDIEVVGTAAEPQEARQKIKELNPDVVTLDIEMPNMNGLAFLDRIMRLRPTPVVMVSTLTGKGAGETLLALELGAVDFVQKPNRQSGTGLQDFGEDVREKVRTAAQSNVRPRAIVPKLPIKTAAAPEGALIAIGASTGGVEAIRAILCDLPADCPPVVIAQHMPAGFTSRFAARLDELSPLTVHEVTDGAELLVGHAYVAPGDWHFRVENKRSKLRAALAQDDPVSGHRPSVDVLFESVARDAPDLAVGVILTGMGGDGARGLKLMRDAGCHTLGQSPASALVYGMPRVAFEMGAVAEQAPLEAMPGRIAAALTKLRNAA